MEGSVLLFRLPCPSYIDGGTYVGESPFRAAAFPQGHRHHLPVEVSKPEESLPETPETLL